MTEWLDVNAPSSPNPPGAPSAPLDLGALRQTYEAGRLDENTVAPTWLEQFTRWFSDARSDRSIVEPNAMQLATAGADGRASVRTVLAKSVSDSGIVYYSHYDSPKGVEVAATGWSAVVFVWLPHQRQVRLSGPTGPVEREVTERYFAERPRGSQLGAWASAQSHVVSGRAELDESLAGVTERFTGADIPPPPGWGGFRLEPLEVEFWQGRANRMHDRLRFRRTDVSTTEWQLERLAP